MKNTFSKRESVFLNSALGCGFILKKSGGSLARFPAEEVSLFLSRRSPNGRSRALPGGSGGPAAGSLLRRGGGHGRSPRSSPAPLIFRFRSLGIKRKTPGGREAHPELTYGVGSAWEGAERVGELRALGEIATLKKTVARVAKSRGDTKGKLQGWGGRFIALG